MGILSNFYGAIARRANDLTPIQNKVRQVLTDGNREMLLGGRNVDGSPAAPLAASTLDRRRGSGPPRVPMSASSRAVTGLVVDVRPSAGRLTVTKSWPGFSPVIEYLSDGTPRMPARPVIGYRAEDLAVIRPLLRNHVVKGG